MAQTTVATLAAGVGQVKHELDKVDEEIRKQLLIATDLDAQAALQLAENETLQQEIAEAEAELAELTVTHDQLSALLQEKTRRVAEEAKDVTQMDVSVPGCSAAVCFNNQVSASSSVVSCRTCKDRTCLAAPAL
jgi:chromosome segregation ATPase